ncbi:hypothetical protein PCASD_18426, partial [Puccinia coronata f. sp. avenae]
MRSFEFTETHLLVVMLQTAELLLVEGLNEDGVNCFLKVEIEKWKLANPDIPDYHCVAQQIPKFYSTSKRHVQSLGKAIATCGHALFKDPKATSEYPYHPIRNFLYQTLTDWIQSKVTLPQFKDLLDCSLPKLSNNNTMSNVWDGSVWRTFADPTDPSIIYTSVSGNLAFSLFVDWFNPFRGKQRSPVSFGAIVLVCLNLPPSARYLNKNLFIFGIIPGPEEPSLKQINNLLQPLVNELNILLHGVWFDRFSRQPRGRSLKAVIFPLIANLPALRKTAGFTSHNSKNFCSFCVLTTKNLHVIDPKKFKPRTHESHISQPSLWNQASTHAERKDISDKQGVGYSALNALPYWRPIKFCGIKLMHNMILGNLKNHAFSFLAIHDAGTILKTTYKDRRNRQLLAQGHTFDFREPSKATTGLKGKRKRTEEVEVLPQIPTHTNPSQTKRIYKQKANKLVSTAPKSQSSMVIANKNHQLQFAPSLPIHPQALIITPEKDDDPVISHQRKKSKRATSTTHSYSLRQTSFGMSDSKSTVGMSMDPPINSSSKGKERQVNKQEGNNSNNITSKLMGTQENINSKRNNNPTSWQTSPGIYSDSENTNNIPSPLKFSLSNHPNSKTQQIASSRSKTQKNFPKGKKRQLLESD